MKVRRGRSRMKARHKGDTLTPEKGGQLEGQTYSKRMSMKRTSRKLSKKKTSKQVSIKVILYLESFSWTLKTLSMMKSKCRQPGPFPQEQV
jgi:hypothetical protein